MDTLVRPVQLCRFCAATRFSTSPLLPLHILVGPPNVRALGSWCASCRLVAEFREAGFEFKSRPGHHCTKGHAAMRGLCATRTRALRLHGRGQGEALACGS
jgi:hypothetical protein